MFTKDEISELAKPVKDRAMKRQADELEVFKARNLTVTEYEALEVAGRKRLTRRARLIARMCSDESIAVAGFGFSFLCQIAEFRALLSKVEAV